MSDKTYEKLKRIRAAETIDLPPCDRLVTHITKSNGEQVEFALRHYQKQMVMHLLMRKRFVVGDDTGLGKCLTKNSLVTTTYGLTKIGDMHDWSGMEPDTFAPVDQDWHVLVNEEKLPVKNFYYGGVKPTIKMRTRYNFEVEGSRVHPLLVWRDCKHQWVEMRDLREGDYICVERREMKFPEVEPTLDTTVKTRGTCATYDLPEKVTPDFARLMGYYIGEGSLTSTSKVQLTQCPKVNPETHADILKLMRGVLNARFTQEVSHSPDLAFHSTYVRAFLAQNGLDYVTSHNRTVPDFILRSTRESNVEFLRGLFEGEGHVLPCGGIEFSTASEELGRVVQIMLTRFGIVSNRSEKVVKNYEHNTYWRLTIFGQDARAFRDKIGFVSSRKRDALESALDRSMNPNHDVIPCCKSLIEPLRARLKAVTSRSGGNGNRKGSGLKQFGCSFVNTLNNIRNRGRNPSYAFLEHYLDVCAQHGLTGTSAWQNLNALQESCYFYDPVVSLTEGEAEVFDIEVDDPRHWFVANGVVSHNTAECISSQCYMWTREPNLIPIVITTTSAMRQWAGEFHKFTNGVDTVVVDGGPDKRKKIYDKFFHDWSPENPSVLILNYPRMRIDYRKLKKHLDGRQYALWMDEAAAVKSPSTATHTAAKRLAEHAWRAYGITATLIKNNLLEGFGIYSVVVPGLFSSEKGFMRNFCVTKMQSIGKGRRVPVIVGHSRDHIKLFRERIDPYYLGRAKHTVAKELPTLTTKEVVVPMSRSQWKHYQDAVEGLLTVNEAHEMVAEASLIDPDADDAAVETSHLTQLIYCQEIVNDLYLIGNEGISHKVEMLLDMLEGELAGEKVIVFTRFRKMVDRLQELLGDKGYELGIAQDHTGAWQPRTDCKQGLVRVTGAESSEEREAGRQAFVGTEGTNLIFLTMAGAEALNLQEARVMVFFDLPWSAGDYLQLVGRMIRIGSPHQSVYAIHMISEGPFGEATIDRHVAKTLDRKMGYIEGALGQRLLGNQEDQEDDFMFGDSSPTRALYDAMLQSVRESQGSD